MTALPSISTPVDATRPQRKRKTKELNREERSGGGDVDSRIQVGKAKLPATEGDIETMS